MIRGSYSCYRFVGLVISDDLPDRIYMTIVCRNILMPRMMEPAWRKTRTYGAVSCLGALAVWIPLIPSQGLNVSASPGKVKLQVPGTSYGPGFGDPTEREGLQSFPPAVLDSTHCPWLATPENHTQPPLRINRSPSATSPSSPVGEFVPSQTWNSVLHDLVVKS